MQVNLNTQNFNNSTNFKALKVTKNDRAIAKLYGTEGLEAKECIIDVLNDFKVFRHFCKKYDVYVDIKPTASESKISILPFKKLSVDIYAKKINKGLCGVFKKENKTLIASYSSAGDEKNFYQLAKNIIQELRYRDNFRKTVWDFVLNQIRTKTK